MAGQPVTTERMAMLDANADFIFELMEQGESLRTISVRIADKLQEPIGYAMLGKWVQRAENEQRADRARAVAADHRAESVLDRSETLVRDVALGLKGRDDIAAARIANDADQWIAGVWNRSRYGQQQASVTVNVGSLLLEAMRPAVESPKPLELARFDAEDVEFAEAAPTKLEDLL